MTSAKLFKHVTLLMLFLAVASARPAAAKESRREGTPTYDIFAVVTVFETQTLSRVISLQGSVTHTECTDGRITAHIERQCFPSLYQPNSKLFSATTPLALRNPFSSDADSCFTVIGGQMTKVTQNCFEAEVVVRQCGSRMPEECSWSLRNGTRYVAQAVAEREARLQVGSEYTIWRNVRPGTFEFTLPERPLSPELQYEYHVNIRNTATGEVTDLTSDAPLHEGMESSFDASWRKLKLIIR
jgi:hypothetical protein